MEFINATGRRKSSIARIYMSEGKGNITINDRSLEVYFPTLQLQHAVTLPLLAANVVGKYDIKATITGGGTTGQSEAMKLAIARALVKVSEENKPALKKIRLLTRDPREVERKKPGRPGARKRFQFSKR
jgi:small subunit ribosomal protein S9